MNAFPEFKWAGSEANPRASYQVFYFQENGLDVLADNSGLILLHNSWTPEPYKRMSEDEFLRQDVSLAQLFKQVLDL